MDLQQLVYRIQCILGDNYLIRYNFIELNIISFAITNRSKDKTNYFYLSKKALIDVKLAENFIHNIKNKIVK